MAIPNVYTFRISQSRLSASARKPSMMLALLSPPAASDCLTTMQVGVGFGDAPAFTPLHEPPMKCSLLPWSIWTPVLTGSPALMTLKFMNVLAFAPAPGPPCKLFSNHNARLELKTQMLLNVLK